MYAFFFPVTVGSFLFTMELFYLQLTSLAFLLRGWSFFTYNLSFLLAIGAFFAYSEKVRLISARRDCKQRSLTQKAGDDPNFRKKTLGVKRPFSELWRVPGHSWSNSRSSENNSRNEKSHSRNGVSRLEQCENHNSRSNSRSDSRNCCEPTRKIFIAPAFSERFFKNWGGPRAPD